MMTIPAEVCRIRKKLQAEGTPENLTDVSAEGATPADALAESLRQKDGAAEAYSMCICVCIDPPELPENRAADFFLTKGDVNHGTVSERSGAGQ